MPDDQDSGFESVVSDEPKGPASVPIRDPNDDALLKPPTRIPDTVDKPNLNPKVEIKARQEPQVTPIAFQAPLPEQAQTADTFQPPPGSDEVPRRGEGETPWQETRASTFGGPNDAGEVARWSRIAERLEAQGRTREAQQARYSATHGAAGEDLTGEDTHGVALPASTVQRSIGPINDDLKGRMARHEIQVEVLNPDTGRSKVVPLIDFGPAQWTNKGIDLMSATAKELGADGSSPVRWRLVSTDGHPHIEQPKEPAETLLGHLRRWPQYDKYDDDALLEAYRKKHYADVNPESFRNYARAPGGKAKLDELQEQKVDERLTGLERLRKSFPEASSWDDDRLLEYAYKGWTNPNKESLDDFKERMNPPSGFMAVLNNVWRETQGAGKSFLPGMVKGFEQNVLGKSNAFAASAVEADRWLQGQPWYKLVNPTDWLSSRLGQTATGRDDFRDAVGQLHSNALAMQQKAQQIQASKGLGGAIGAGLGQAAGSLPDAALSFALQGASPAANLIWGMTYEQVSAQAQAIDAKAGNDLKEGILSGGNRAVQQYLLSSPMGRLASGGAQLALGLTDQAAQAFIQGKPNPLDQWTAAAAVDFTLGALMGRRKELSPAMVEELDKAHQAREDGNLPGAGEGVDRVMGLLPGSKRQEIAGLIEDRVREIAHGQEQAVGVQAQPSRTWEPPPPEAPGGPVEQPQPAPGYGGGERPRDRQQTPPPPEPDRPPEDKRPPNEEPKPVSPNRRKIREAYRGITRETQEMVKGDPEYNAAIQEQKELAASLPEPARKTVQNDTTYRAILREYQQLQDQFKNPYVPVDELYRRVGGEREAFMAELADMAKNHELSPSTGEPAFASPEALENAFEMGGEKFLHVRIEPEEKVDSGAYFMMGLDPFRAIKQLSYLADLIKPIRAGAQAIAGRMKPVQEYERTWQRAFDPEALGPEGEKAGAAVAEANAQAATESRAGLAQAVKDSGVIEDFKAMGLEQKLRHPEKSQNREAFWKRFTDRRLGGMLIARERGQPIPDPVASRLMELYKGIYDLIAKLDQKAGIEYKLQEEYVPHLFESPQEFDRYMRWRDQQYHYPKPGFSKPREFDDLAQAHEAGFKLKTYNPERLLQLRWAASIRARAKIRALEQMESMGAAIKAKDAPEGLTWPSDVRSPNGVMYSVHPDALAVLKNAWDHGRLHDSVAGPAFKFFSALKGTVGLNLGLSFFHPLHITGIRIADANTTFQIRFLQGKAKPQDFLKMLSGYTAGTSETMKYGSVVDFAQGNFKKGQIPRLSPEQLQQLQYAHEAGLDLSHSRERQYQWASWLTQTFHAPKALGQAAKAIDAPAGLMLRLLTNEDFGHFYFGKVIPSIKLASLLERADGLFRLRPELRDNRSARLVAFRQIGRDIEGRFGEMNYDNLFWNKTAKDVGVSTFLSMGWQLSLFRIYGGAIQDLTHNAAHMDEIARTWRQEGTAPALRQMRLARILMAANYTALPMLINAVATAIFTRTPPQWPKDYVYARVGKNPDGTDKHIQDMFFNREFFSVYEHIRDEGVAGGVGTFAQNKLQPVLASAIEAVRNANYMGQEIYSKDWSTLQRQRANMADIVAHFMGNLMPFSLQNNVRLEGQPPFVKLQPGQNPGDAVAGILGWNKAPMWTTRDAMENDIIREFRREHGHTIPREEVAKMQTIHELRDAQQRKDQQGIAAAVQSLQKLGASKQTIRNGIRYADVPVSMKVFKQLRTDEQVKRLRQMPPEKAKEYLKWSSLEARHQYRKAHLAPGE